MKDENKFLVEYTTLFNKQLREAPLEIKISFREVRELFIDNPGHPQLRNHALRGRFAGFKSIDVTDDWRALFKIRKSKAQTVFTFHILGTHAQLYE